MHCLLLAFNVGLKANLLLGRLKNMTIEFELNNIWWHRFHRHYMLVILYY